MPLILESIVVTTSAAGEAHVAPYGLIADGDGYVLAPFRPSPAIANLAERPVAVASAPADIRILAGCVTGRRDWPTEPAERVDGRRLADAWSHIELAVARVEEDATRPRYHCRVVHEVAVRPFRGFNRAEAAVIEAAILSTRLAILPREKIERELGYLAIAVDKTAGPAELEAWGWIEARIRHYFEGPDRDDDGRE